MTKNLSSPPNPNPNPNSSFNSSLSSSVMAPNSPFSSTISSYSIPSPSSIPPPTSPPTVFHVSFNQDYTSFVMATDRGFFVFECEPVKEAFKRQQDSGFSIVQMLYQYNIMACVGTGTGSGFASSKLMMWDDRASKYIGELSVRSEVRAVRLRNDRIVVVLTQKILVHRFQDFKLVNTIETYPNDKGLCEVSKASGSMVLVCLGLRKGEVRAHHYGLRKTKFIVAHTSRIACLALSDDGRFLATASVKGTLVRLYNTLDGLLLQEVRRGIDLADIHSLAFSSTAQWLAVSSDKATVHVFSLKVDSGSPGVERPNSTKSSSVTSAVSNLPFIKGMLPKYFSSEWSVAQFRLPERSQYIVGFGHQKNTVLIVGMDGSFYHCQFDPDCGGEMKQLEFHNVLKVQEEESV